jgi:ApbE superfamily uncharacterized protein (UPF0280 family)
MYTDRFYRQWMQPAGLGRFQVAVGESDLLILCDQDLERLAREEVHRVRGQVEDWIARDPLFATSLEPRGADQGPPVVRDMARAGRAWDVGPMAAVAGAVAEHVGRRLLEHSETVIVENGGDVFARADEPLVFRLYAGEASPFSDRIAFEVDGRDGVGVCTSSGLVGPSLSLGRADAVVAVAASAVEADAAATALANLIEGPGDVEAVVAGEERRGRLDALLACAGDSIGIWGNIQVGRT